MDKQERLNAMLDVLKYWRKPGRALREGRQLSPWLLGRAYAGDEDDWALAQAVQALIMAEWLQACRRADLPTAQALDQVDMWVVLRQALIGGQGQVARYTLLWAYYLQSQSSAYIADQAGVSRRQIQLLIQEARDLLDQALMRQVFVPAPLPMPSVPSLIAEPRIAMVAPVEQTLKLKPKPSGHRYTTVGEVEQVTGILIVGDVDAAVTQHITNTYYLPAPRKPRRVAEQVFAIGGLLLLGIGYRLFVLWPEGLLGLLVGLALARMARLLWFSRDCWQQWELSDRYWYLTCLMVWSGLNVWLALLYGQVARFGLITPRAADVRVVVQVVALLGALLYLAMVDLLAWVRGMDVLRWPLAWLQPLAERVERTRWLALNGVSGFLLLVLIMLALFS